MGSRRVRRLEALTNVPFASCGVQWVIISSAIAACQQLDVGRCAVPIGCSSLVPYVVREIHRLRPNKILDVGIGMGFYGAVVRQWRDYGVGRFCGLYGVEPWDAYRNEVWETYNDVYIGTVGDLFDGGRHVLDGWVKPSGMDLILLLDVIEHMEFDEGEQAIANLRSILALNGALLIGTPAVFMSQGLVHGNVYETHRTLWEPEMFKGADVLWKGGLDQFGNQMVMVRYGAQK